MDAEATWPTPTHASGNANHWEDDRDLISRAQNGSREAADELVRRYWGEAFKAAYLILGNREDAEDVTQESFVAALDSLHRFRRGKPFQPWLRRIVANRAIDSIRGTKRRVRRDEQIATRTSVSAPEAVDDLRVSDPALAEAVAALAEDQRLVVVLHTVFGYGTGDMAKLLKTPRGTIASRLHRGLEHLRRGYGGSDEQH